MVQIVDLIRSDLLSCCIPSTVTVPKLIALESYGVHNLVTTVQGTLAGNVGSVEAVKRCFPPGMYRDMRRSWHAADEVNAADRFHDGCTKIEVGTAFGWV